jgi:hypothetical protein
MEKKTAIVETKKNGVRTFYRTMLLAFVVALASSSTARAIPSYWLDNWDATNTLLGFWVAASNSWTVPPVRYSGIQSVRLYWDLMHDVLKTIALPSKSTGHFMAIRPFAIRPILAAVCKR